MERVEMARVVHQVESIEEVWETTGNGWVYAQVTGVDGKPRTVKAGGRPGQKLRITEYDRLKCQEKVLSDVHDIFQNGMLIRVDQASEEENPNWLSAEAIIELFSITGPAFNTRVDALNEYNVRRLLDACEDLDATNSQEQYLKQTLAQKWPIGGEMPMYRELQGLGEVASPTR
jgi:hypothetical protein